MRHRQGIYDRFFELLDDFVQASDIVKADGDIFGGDNLQGYLVFVFVEDKILDLVAGMAGIVGAMATFLQLFLFCSSYPPQIRLCLYSGLLLFLAVWVH